MVGLPINFSMTTSREGVRGRDAVQQGTEELDDAIHVFDYQNLCHWIPVKVVRVGLIGGGRSIASARRCHEDLGNQRNNPNAGLVRPASTLPPMQEC
jgi:hypothetical protein